MCFQEQSAIPLSSHPFRQTYLLTRHTHYPSYGTQWLDLNVFVFLDLELDPEKSFSIVVIAAEVQFLFDSVCIAKESAQAHNQKAFKQHDMKHVSNYAQNQSLCQKPTAILCSLIQGSVRCIRMGS